MYEYYPPYHNAHTKIRIHCSKHGLFSQTPNSHLRGRGCPKCADEQVSMLLKMECDEFEKRAKIIHKNRYNYHQDYVNSKSKVKITCVKHGDFWQQSGTHLRGAGCPRCRRSKGEEKVSRFLNQQGITYKDEHTFDNCRNKNVLPFDFFLLNWRICIEYQGMQHFKTLDNDFFGGEKAFEYRKNNDQIKRDFCKKKGIILVEIPYNDERIAQRVLGAIAQRKREREENPIQQKLLSTDWGQPFIFGEQLDLFNRPQTYL